MIIALSIAVIFFIIVNLVQSTVGILPKLARIYDTKVDFNERISIWHLEHLYFVEQCDYNKGKSFENRPWLIIKPLDIGLFVKQSGVLQGSCRLNC